MTTIDLQKSCYCGHTTPFSGCCEPYLKGKSHAPTPEALMRSRYTAHVLVNVAYLKETLAPSERKSFDEKDVRKWATESEWLGLKILKSYDKTVEFVATYKTQGKVLEHHEVATFSYDRDHGRWYFVDGDAHVHEEGKGHEHHAPLSPIVREGPKVGRNDPCPCGSGKKFKKCCGL